MDLTAFNRRDRQNCLAIINAAKNQRLTLEDLATLLMQDNDQNVTGTTPSERHRPGNIARCSVCGFSAAIVAVNSSPGNQIGGGYTHAVQCQNRPATGQQWDPTHCGHTEYIMK